MLSVKSLKRFNCSVAAMNALDESASVPDDALRRLPAHPASGPCAPAEGRTGGRSMRLQAAVRIRLRSMRERGTADVRLALQSCRITALCGIRRGQGCPDSHGFAPRVPAAHICVAEDMRQMSSCHRTRVRRGFCRDGAAGDDMPAFCTMCRFRTPAQRCGIVHFCLFTRLRIPPPKEG